MEVKKTKNGLRTFDTTHGGEKEKKPIYERQVGKQISEGENNRKLPDGTLGRVGTGKKV